MLPLVQAHHSMVPNSNIDSVSPRRSDPRTPNNHFQVQHANSHQYFSFPIRTIQPQPNQISLNTHALSNRQAQEYQLRRKTPNGTIDGGYDGFPIGHTTGHPPLKQLVRPAYSGASLQFQRRTIQGPFTHAAHGVELSTDLSAAATIWTNDAVTPPAPFASFDSAAHRSQAYEQTSYHGSHPFGGAFQPVIRANEYNVRAFCPPPPTLVGGLPFGHIGWHATAPTWPCHTTSVHAAITTVQNERHPFPTGLDTEFQATLGEPLPFSITHPFETVYPQLTGPETCPIYVTKHHAYDSQSGFKEKALSQAFTCYANVIGHVQASRKLSFNRDTGAMENATSRHLIFPKPPRPRRETNMPPLAADSHLSVDEQRTRMHHGLAPTGQDVVGHNPDYHFGQGPPSSGVSFLAGIDQFRALHSAPAGNSVAISTNFSAPSVGASPVADTRASIELLKSLCEQSLWGWLDGILILGCLYYALEEYGNSLQCFSRIVHMEPRHVEGVANMAAALYCLERYDEAEQQWLRAVQLRPSYLEAAEHLVGLLYKKRSREAIEIISYVQRALMTNTTTTPVPNERHGRANAVDTNAKSKPAASSGLIYAAHSNAATMHTVGAIGHGSSGYSLPASENGRILALVHAKGTMLYGLKDVEGAAYAFEEAVLISVGRRITGIRELVRCIQLSISQAGTASSGEPGTPLSLLLTPEKARHTARLVFGGDGELPGLKLVTDHAPRRAAVQTTSNSLLSLAKIFQDSMSGGSAGSAFTQPSPGVGDILALYYLSLSLQESPSTANNVGILLAGIPVATSVHSTDPGTTPSSTRNQPNISGIAAGSGPSLALAYYNYGLRLDPKHVHLHTNLGSLLKDVGQLDLAIQMYERAVACDSTFDIALTNLANAVKDKGRINDAISYYRRAVTANPGFAEAVCGLFTALNSVCDWRGRGGMYLYSGLYDRWHVDERGLLVDATAKCSAGGLAKSVVDIVCQQLEEAAQWGRHVLDDTLAKELSRQLQHLCEDPTFELTAQLCGWIGSRWAGSRLLRLIERASKVMLRKWYIELYGRDATTKKSAQHKRPQLPPSLSIPSAPTVLPFHTFTCPLNAKQVRVISQRNATRISCSTLRSPWLPQEILPPPSPPKPHINVGYVSSDFNNHPLAHLMQSVFGFHDARRVKAFCYATTPSDKSTFRQKIEREAPTFYDVSNWPPERLIKQIHDDGIHILVNLNGYTRGARNEIFAARPAPIQMSFMGFAGTLGAEWCDYILADAIAIPPATLRPWRQNRSLEDIFFDQSEDDQGEWIYPENVIFCRDTFFCCDHAQSAEPSERSLSWEDEERRRWKMRRELFPKLPEDTIILANFNQLYKIEPSIFRSWLRILAQTPNAVLWLLRFPESGESNLRRTAELWAGAEVASRIIFTDVAQKNQHISRARVCDLFLDTPECNAHTTAADVLWSSTPLLTLPRYPYKMCSRMAASILRGALPRSAEGNKIAQELIANTEAEYEMFATRLAGGLRYSVGQDGPKGTGRLAEIRKVLWDSKWTCGLFNTRRWVRDVEDAYEEAWTRWESGCGGDIYL